MITCLKEKDVHVPSKKLSKGNLAPLHNENLKYQVGDKVFAICKRNV